MNTQVLTCGAVDRLIDAETGNGMEKAGQMARMEMSLMIKTIYSLCSVRNEMDEDPTIIACKEVITQGCCLSMSMVCYGIALMPLAE